MVRGISRKPVSRGGGNYGGSLETWDFDACGERFLGKDAPAKEAPPFPPFLPPPHLYPPGVHHRQLEPCWVPSVS